MYVVSVVAVCVIDVYCGWKFVFDVLFLVAVCWCMSLLVACALL
jgi:hypothetical protein